MRNCCLGVAVACLLAVSGAASAAMGHGTQLALELETAKQAAGPPGDILQTVDRVASAQAPAAADAVRNAMSPESNTYVDVGRASYAGIGAREIWMPAAERQPLYWLRQ